MTEWHQGYSFASKKIRCRRCRETAERASYPHVFVVAGISTSGKGRAAVRSARVSAKITRCVAACQMHATPDYPGPRDRYPKDVGLPGGLSFDASVNLANSSLGTLRAPSSVESTSHVASLSCAVISNHPHGPPLRASSHGHPQDLPDRSKTY